MIGLLLSLIGNQFIETGGDEIDVPLWFEFLGIAMLAIYETVGIAVWGKTVGKVAGKEKVVRFDDGEPLRPHQAAIRALVPLTPWIVAIPLVGAANLGVQILYPLIYLSAAIHPMRRGLHDLAAGSVVLRTG